MKYIYMNEFIGQKDADVPVIAVWDPNSKRLVYTNYVEIKDRHGIVIARVKYGERPPKEMPHEAAAWIEVYELIAKVEPI